MGWRVRELDLHPSGKSNLFQHANLFYHYHMFKFIIKDWFKENSITLLFVSFHKKKIYF